MHCLKRLNLIGIALDVPIAKGFCHRQRYLGFRQDKPRSLLGHGGFHLLLFGNRFGSATFGLRSCYTGVCFSLIRLQSRANVFPDVNIGDVDGDDFEGGLSIESTPQNSLGDHVRIFENVLMRLRGSNGSDDAFAHTGNHSIFSRTTD